MVKATCLGPSSKTAQGMDALAELFSSGRITAEELSGFKVLGMPPLASPRSAHTPLLPLGLQLGSPPHALYFMPMPGLPPSPSPSRLYTTSSSRLQSRRWEGVLYSVQFAFPCPLSLALGTFPEEQDFSLKFASVLSLAGLTVTGTVDFRL